MSQLAVLGLCAWPLVLVVLLVLVRQFDAPTEHPRGGPAFHGRLIRAHANCYEFLPFAVAVLVFALATGAAAVTDPLAPALLGARLVQSLVHLVSVAPAMVLVRLAFFITQVAITLIWIVQLGAHYAATHLAGVLA